MASHQSSVDEDTAVNADEVSRLSGLSTITLAQMRLRGEGPRFLKIGRAVRYRIGDVRAWLTAHTVGGGK